MRKILSFVVLVCLLPLRPVCWALSSGEYTLEELYEDQAWHELHCVISLSLLFYGDLALILYAQYADPLAMSKI